jgi:transcriptional regulator with PAS, ATPase and Fis domain
VRFFIKKYNNKFHRNVQDISELVLAVLSHYSWPGNIRELENLVERMIALAEKPTITEGDIPVEYLVSNFETLKQQSPDGDVMAQATKTFEKNFILKILEKEQWNQTKTAKRLGIHRKTLEYKIKKYKLAAIITQKRPVF